MKFVSTFSERFSQLTENQTYQQVADKLGISKTTVCYYATGARKPKQPALRHIAEQYNVDPVWLIGGDVPRTRQAYKNENAGLLTGVASTPERRELLELIDSLPDEAVSRLLQIARLALGE